MIDIVLGESCDLPFTGKCSKDRKHTLMQLSNHCIWRAIVYVDEVALLDPERHCVHRRDLERKRPWDLGNGGSLKP